MITSLLLCIDAKGVTKVALSISKTICTTQVPIKLSEDLCPRRGDKGQHSFSSGQHSCPSGKEWQGSLGANQCQECRQYYG